MCLLITSAFTHANAKDIDSNYKNINELRTKLTLQKCTFMFFINVTSSDYYLQEKFKGNNQYIQL